LSEGEEKMKTPKTLYILIGIFCVFAIIAGIYAQFIEKRPSNENNQNDENVVVSEKDRETIKEEFNSLFTNTINLNGFDTTGILKLKDDKEIVYSAYDMSESTDAYEVNIHVPVVNIKNDVVSSFNNITQAIFANKANEVRKRTDVNSKAIYSIDYVAYVNGDILSVVIKSTLKEGKSAQRIIVQTYNYNLSTNQSVTLNDLVTRKELNKDDVNQKIKLVVQEGDNEAKTLQDIGYNTTFSRDLSSSMYTVENSGTYFLGDNNKLYIIYAYGNQNFTSEMDIVLFE